VTQFSETTRKQIAELCKKYSIRELSLFGSRARGESMDDSDHDFLVEFFSDTTVTFMTLGAVQTDLEEIVKTKVDLVPKEGLKPAIKDRVLSQAQIIYAG
jgi:predicted nucleotidyltransferase